MLRLNKKNTNKVFYIANWETLFKAMTLKYSYLPFTWGIITYLMISLKTQIKHKKTHCGLDKLTNKIPTTLSSNVNRLAECFMFVHCYRTLANVFFCIYEFWNAVSLSVIRNKRNNMFISSKHSPSIIVPLWKSIHSPYDFDDERFWNAQQNHTFTSQVDNITALYLSADNIRTVIRRFPIIPNENEMFIIILMLYVWNCWRFDGNDDEHCRNSGNNVNRSKRHI